MGEDGLIKEKLEELKVYMYKELTQLKDRMLKDNLYDDHQLLSGDRSAKSFADKTNEVREGMGPKMGTYLKHQKSYKRKPVITRYNFRGRRFKRNCG